MKNYPPSPKRGVTYPVTDSLGKTVDETGDSISLLNLNTIIINKNMVIFYKKWKKSMKFN